MSGVIGAVLAAGLSSRMGPANKLTKPWQGKPLLGHVVDAAMASQLQGTMVITGHQADEVAAMLPPSVTIITNADFESGMASSLRRAAQTALNSDAEGLLVLLGDMPLVSAADINHLVDVFAGDPSSIVQGAQGEKAGHPVLFPRHLWTEFAQLTGDTGAKPLLRRHAEQVHLVDIGSAALRDFDTAEAFEEPLS